MLGLSLEVIRIDMIRNEHIKVTAKVSVLETKLERADRNGLDMCRGGTVAMLVEGCYRWSHQAGNTEDIHGCYVRDMQIFGCDRKGCRGEEETEDDDSL